MNCLIFNGSLTVLRLCLSAFCVIKKHWHFEKKNKENKEDENERPKEKREEGINE